MKFKTLIYILLTAGSPMIFPDDRKNFEDLQKLIAEARNSNSKDIFDKSWSNIEMFTKTLEEPQLLTLYNIINVEIASDDENPFNDNGKDLMLASILLATSDAELIYMIISTSKNGYIGPVNIKLFITSLDREVLDKLAYTAVSRGLNGTKKWPDVPGD